MSWTSSLLNWNESECFDSAGRREHIISGQRLPCVGCLGSSTAEGLWIALCPTLIPAQVYQLGRPVPLRRLRGVHPPGGPGMRIHFTPIPAQAYQFGAEDHQRHVRGRRVEI